MENTGNVVRLHVVQRRRVVRWIVDGTVVAVTLTLGGLALFAPPPATEPAKQTVSADLEREMLQPRIAPTLPAVSDPAPVTASAPPPQTASLAPSPAEPPPAQAANTVTVNGVTYVAGEEPRSLGTITVDGRQP